MRTFLVRLSLLGALLVASAGPALAEEGGEHAHGEHHHGPLHIGDVIAFDRAHAPFWASVLNFVLLLLLLRRMGRTPVSAFLQGRRREMEQRMREAAAMKEKAEARYKEYTERMATLDAELDKLKQDIVAAAEEDKKRISAEAEEASRRLKHETELLIDQHAKALSATAQREAVEAAIAAAEQHLRTSITAADQQRLADAFRQRLSVPGGAAAKGSRGEPS